MQTGVEQFREAVKAIPHITRLSTKDEPLLRAAMRSASVTYASSWLYILRTAHVGHGEMGYKYVTNDLVAVIGFRHNHLYVTPVYDTTSGIALQHFCERLSDTLPHTILVKKFSDERFGALDYKETPEYVPQEDDSYRETTVHLQKLFNQESGRINPIAHKLHRRSEAFKRHGLAFDVVTDIAEVPLLKLEQFLAKDDEKFANYIQILRYLYLAPHDTYRYRTMVFLHDGDVRGLYMCEVLSLSDLGLYGGVTSKDVGGITEWMDIYFFNEMLDVGVQTVHLGGAENGGIAEYVTKLSPYKPAYSTRTVQFDPTRKYPRSLTSIRLVNEKDFSQLAHLYLDVYNGMGQLGETWTLTSAHRFISHFHKRQPDLFFLAEQAGVIVGAAVAAIQPWWDGNHLVEGEIFIDPEYAESDVQQRLLKQLLARARFHHDAVSWDTIVPTVNAHPLANYKKIGFKKAPYWAAITGDVHTILKQLDV
jgi:L-amino acid N-acyltransferase YncA